MRNTACFDASEKDSPRQAGANDVVEITVTTIDGGCSTRHVFYTFMAIPLATQLLHPGLPAPLHLLAHA